VDIIIIIIIFYLPSKKIISNKKCIIQQLKDCQRSIMLTDWPPVKCNFKQMTIKTNKDQQRKKEKKRWAAVQSLAHVNPLPLLRL